MAADSSLQKEEQKISALPFCISLRPTLFVIEILRVVEY